MIRRLVLIVVFASLLVIPALIAPATVESLAMTSTDRSSGLIAHEWGTFTSVAGESGRAVPWLPHSGPTDLPCFVERIKTGFKGFLSGTVRMETPVIYFYAPQPMSVEVNVRFRQGVITEWFPRPGGTSITPATAAAALRGELAWKNVQVVPGGSEQFPIEPEPNHYYVARQTEAAPLHVGRDEERFLFYRGVGRLPPPISATVSSDGQIVVSQTRGDALGDLMLFENRDGTTAYRSVHASSSQVTFSPLALEADAPSPQKHLEQLLITHGLYPTEARAMVESWQGSWFEHGARLFYIVANEHVDAMLPLEINPKPIEIKRVFVGRMEIATPKTLNEITVALERNDQRVLAKYGRFLQPIARRVLTGLPRPDALALERRMNSAYAPWLTDPAVCRATTN
jgi:hypothetical protein